MEYVIPTWHPFAVHFPIALLFLAALASVVWVVNGRALWRAVTGLALGLGTLGALVANRTGEALHDEVEGTPIVEELVERHEQFGEWALWTGLAATFAWLGLALWRRRREFSPEEADPVALRFVVTALVLAAAVFVLLAGRLGGTMVWGIPG